MSSLPSDITVPGRPEVHEVSAGVYAYIQPDGTWWINNTGFLVGPQGVISIDSCSTHRRTRAYQAAIAAVTPAPVRTVVNTHHHGDHTFGNCLFPAAAIVGHESARAEAIAFGPPRELPFWDGPDWGELSLDPPFVTFTDEIAVHAGRPAGVGALRRDRRAHHQRLDRLDPGALRAVLRRPDLQRRHAVPADGLGGRRGRGAGTGRARRSAPGSSCRATVPCSRATGPLDATLDYLRFVLEVAARAQAAGVTPLDAARDTDLGRFADWADPERIVGNLHRACAELAGTPRGGPIDVPAALADMVAYNGGAPLTCLA